jgi:hypothetical protein
MFFLHEKSFVQVETMFLILCLICLKGQHCYGGSHKNPFQFYFSEKKRNNTIFLKLCLSLKGQATIWEGAESFQNFLSIFLFNFFFFPWLCLGFKGGRGAPKFLQIFLFKK